MSGEHPGGQAILLGGFLERWSAEAADREALACACDRLTWLDLQERVRAVAGCLAENGVLPGDIVPIGLDNGCAMAAAVLGALRSGARPLLLSPGLTAAEREALLAPWGIRTACVPLGHAEEWALHHPALGLPLEIPHEPAAWRAFCTVHAGASTLLGPGPGSPSGSELLIPTSGSTGVPKIVRLSESGTVWNASAHMASVGLDGRDRVLIATPLHHAATLVAQFVGALVIGASAVFAEGPFNARGFWETVVRERITAVALTPTHVQMLLARPQAVPRGPDSLPLRCVTVGSAPIAPDVLRAFAALLASACDATVRATYGLTEAGPRVTTLPAGSIPGKAGSVGLPLVGVAVRIADPLHPDLPLLRGEEGELQVRTPSRMLGYLGEPPCEAEWLRTGDLATIDDEGFVTLRGRLKELIVSGGVNVSPVEVEHALCRDARVREAAVTGEPHPLLGEIVRAFVVPAVPVDEHTLLATLAGYLAPYKLPRRVDFLEALPRTATGKVDKRRLRDLAQPS